MLFALPKAPRAQLVLIPQCLDELVADDAPVRRLDALLREVGWGPWERKYEGCGQPPIHPRYLAGAILYGLMHKLRSTRDLEMAACKHLDFIWLLEGFAPDHSTFANFRLRHVDAIKGLHEHIAKVLVMQRHTDLLHLIIDGTRFRADSDRHGARTAKTIEMVIAELERRMNALAQGDEAPVPQPEYFEGMAPEEDEQEKLALLNKEIAKLQEQRAKYQKALGIARQRDARAQKHNGKKAKAVRVPVCDPESHVTPNKEGGYAPNYTPVATVESQTGAIVHADVLPASDEASAVLPAVSAAQALTGQKADAVLADGNFASGQTLEALGEAGIEAYMPTRSVSPPNNPALRPDPSTPVAQEDCERLPRYGGKFARTAFVYDEAAGVYYCPMGHAMSPYKRGKNKDGVQCTWYQCKACPECPRRSDCIRGKGALRSITRDEHEALREAAAKRMATTEGKAIYKQRAPGIEGVFARIKSAMGIRRFSVRGLAKVRSEWTWICTAYNLKKLLRTGADPSQGGAKVTCANRSWPQKRRQRRLWPAWDVSSLLARHQWVRGLNALGRCAHMENAAHV
jgi:transposase